jgi:hypothetical protein
MTEDQAKTKKCPIFGIVIAITASVDALRKDLPKQAIINSGLCCIASDCMMWRFDLTREEASIGAHPENGHCGLAGNP